MSFLKKHGVNAIGVILIVAALFFIVKKLVALDVDFSIFASPKMLLIIAGLSVVQLISVFILAYAWRLVLGYFVHLPIEVIKAIGVYFKSNITKYIPGNLGQFVGRQIFGISLGMTQTQLVLSSLFEIGFTVLSALIIAIVFSGNKFIEVYPTLFSNSNYLLVIIVACILLVIIILPLIFRKHRIVAVILLFFKEKGFWIRSAAILPLYIVQFLVFGMVFALLVRLSMTISIIDVFVILAASAVSWLAGFITPGVPGGIGIRESVLVLMLPMYPQDIILSAAIVQRVIMVLGDIFAWGISMVLLKKK